MAVEFDSGLENAPGCIIRQLIIHLESVNAAVSALDFILMGEDGSDTHKKYSHEVTALTIEKDATDTTKGVVVYDFGECGFAYTELDYCGPLQSFLCKVDNALGATIKSAALRFEI